MDFELSDAQLRLQSEVRRFADTVVKPTAEERSRESRWDNDLYQQLGELGWPGVVIPTEYSGMGGGAIEHAVIVEELSRVDASIGGALNLLQQAVMAILSFAPEHLKRRYLPLFSRAETFSITGLTEAAAGSKLSDMKTVAMRDGDGWLIDGTKTEVHIPQHVQVCLVYAKSENGISAFVVDTATEGFRVGADREIIGMRGLPMSVVHFRKCWVPDENLLGEEGKGLEVFFKSFDLTRIGNAAKCIGIADGALADAIRYATHRRVGDNVVTDFQGLRWQIVDLKTRLEAARLLTYRAAYTYQKLGRSTVESNMAKLLASTTAMEATTTALQITGSYGCFGTQPFARYMMDAKVSQLTGGSVEILRNSLARELLGKPTHPVN